MLCLAENEYSENISVSFSDLGVEENSEYEISLRPLDSVKFYSYSGTVSGVNYAEQLSGNSKSVYDVLGKLHFNSKSLQMFLTNPISFTSETTSPTEEELEPVYAEIKRFTQMAVDAYSRDYPDNFWLDIKSSVYNFTYSGRLADGWYQWKITMLTYKPAYKTEYSDNISLHVSKFNKAVDEFKVEGKTTYEKVKSIYTQICEQTTYKTQSFCFVAYGPLVANYGVCSGYAKAFKAICDRENIPCVLVSGTGIDNDGKRDSHMWNLVKMDDGKWYCVDTTWADEGTISYDFLLTGTDVRLKSLNYRTFNESHLSNGDFSDTGYFSFKYPSASKTAFDPNWVAPTPTPVPTATPIPTATPVPVENPEMGDANRDGIISADDALIVLRVAARLLDNSYGWYDYGDVQNDGIFTAEDALLILKISAKIS